MAGVPSVAEAMVASILPTLMGGAPLLSRNLRVVRGEGDIAGALVATLSHPIMIFPSARIRSKDGIYGANIVIRSADAKGAFGSGIMAALSGNLCCVTQPCCISYTASLMAWPAAAKQALGVNGSA
jgi:molybdopterin-biosynthesis enzyme MoeA-like protein